MKTKYTFLKQFFLSMVITCSIGVITTTNAQVQLGQDLNGESASDEFGEAVTMNGDGSIVAIGGLLNDGGGIDAGHVRVFQFDASSGQWEQLGEDIDGGAGDFLGTAVSLSEDGFTIAIGANGNGDNGVFAGQARVFTFNTTTNAWEQLGQNIDGLSANDLFGFTLSLSNDGLTLIASAPLSSLGSTRTFRFNTATNQWDTLGQTFVGTEANALFGLGVDINNDGTIMAISSPFGNGGQGFITVYEFDNTLEEWVVVGEQIDNPDGNTFFGIRIALSADGQRLSVGDPGSDSGVVIVYDFNTTTATWEQLGNTITGSAAGDGFGERLDMNDDGTIVVVHSNLSETDENEGGQAEVYRYVNETDLWTLVGTPIDASNLDDELREVGISKDGNRIVAGSLFNDTNGIDSGQARVFDFASVLSIDDTLLDANVIDVYPNPTSNQITIEALNKNIASVTIYDLLGRQVQKNIFESGISQTINIETLDSGTYLIVIEFSIGNTVKRIVKL